MSKPTRSIDVVICWHMHQPCYRVNDEFAEPWVYLHGLKDYAEMAGHLETVEGARAVVNFVPVLLDQLDVYCRELSGYEAGGTTISDPLLRALAQWQVPVEPHERAEFVKGCFHVNEDRVLGRFPHYLELAGFGRQVTAENAAYLSDQFVYDALVWLHLGWLGEHRRARDPRATRLAGKGRSFTPHDGRELLALITEELCAIVPRYRRLADSGAVELSVSPWGHPILPLLLDHRAARETMPDVELPSTPYPGGAERARWHIREGLKSFERHFGRRPQGCWPPEGALSDGALELLDEAGFSWTASGGGVLQNSLAAHDQHLGCHHAPFERAGRRIRSFFRDDELSDLIGFVYKDWTAGEAVDDLIRRLEAIAALCERDAPVVAIILDGENAWEHYPHNAYDFLQTLYGRLARHSRLNLTTFSDHLSRSDGTLPLTGVTAGSWVYGTLSTWIGQPDKNRAWDLLSTAKAAWDRHGRNPKTGTQALDTQLGVCEGSDWFWWFGDQHAGAVVERFDRLYRAQIQSLYATMGVAPPPELAVPLSKGSLTQEHHTMLPSQHEN